ncbi:MAG: 3-deoxy-8-phosphooctulonate synthase [Planctomycetes bacterium]|nr:3-deoxy-8-phosphooctulonate synthase [Planctomycetota bacterium]
MRIRTEEIRQAEIRVGGDAPLLLVAGPDVIESEAFAMETAAALRDIAGRLEVTFVFKASYDKANRSSPDSFRGPGAREGLRILARIRRELEIPVTTDIHGPEQVPAAAEVVDILQIPAFLCRQNDLLATAGRTGKIVNVKKGQFLAPEDMAGRARAATPPGGPRKVVVTERGTTFGYRYLVNDMQALPIIRANGIPLIFDASHSVQRPGGLGDRSGGARDMVPVVARAAAGAGCDGFFFEVHPDPERALCDGPSSLPLGDLEALARDLVAIDRISR